MSADTLADLRTGLAGLCETLQSFGTCGKELAPVAQGLEAKDVDQLAAWLAETAATMEQAQRVILTMRAKAAQLSIENDVGAVVGGAS